MKSSISESVETCLHLDLAVLAHDMAVAEAARSHGVSAESFNRWRNRLVDADKAPMKDGGQARRAAAAAWPRRGDAPRSSSSSRHRPETTQAKGAPC